MFCMDAEEEQVHQYVRREEQEFSDLKKSMFQREKSLSSRLSSCSPEVDKISQPDFD